MNEASGNGHESNKYLPSWFDEEITIDWGLSMLSGRRGPYRKTAGKS